MSDLVTEALGIGEGYNSATGSPGGRSVVYSGPSDLTTTLEHPGSSKTFKLEQITRFEQVKSTLNVAASLSLGWGIFSSDASYSLIESGAFNSFSNYLLVDVRVVNATERLKIARLDTTATLKMNAGIWA